MSEGSLVSLLIIAYNQENYIREAIEGAFAQSYSPLEIILSDDNSPDKTFKIMQEMAAAYQGQHRIILNRNERNVGVVLHIDRVMQLASGQLNVINAGDDVSLPDRVEKLTKAWEMSGRKAKLVHSPAIAIDEGGRMIGIRTSPKAMTDDPSPVSIASDRNYILGATLAWDRLVFDEFGPLGPGLSVEDTIIPFRAALLGGIGYVDEPLIKYRTGGVSGAPGLQVTSQEYLYGISHKLRKWQFRNNLHILNRFAEWPYDGKGIVEAACRKHSELLSLPVELAEASRIKRLGFAPRALRLALRHRTFEPLKFWTMYSFDKVYLRYGRIKSTLRM